MHTLVTFFKTGEKMGEGRLHSAVEALYTTLYFAIVIGDVCIPFVLSYLSRENNSSYHSLTLSLELFQALFLSDAGGEEPFSSF